MEGNKLLIFNFKKEIFILNIFGLCYYIFLYKVKGY